MAQLDERNVRIYLFLLPTVVGALHPQSSVVPQVPEQEDVGVEGGGLTCDGGGADGR